MRILNIEEVEPVMAATLNGLHHLGQKQLEDMERVFDARILHKNPLMCAMCGNETQEVEDNMCDKCHIELMASPDETVREMVEFQKIRRPMFLEDLKAVANGKATMEDINMERVKPSLREQEEERMRVKWEIRSE